LLFEVSRVGESGGQEEGLTVGCGTTGELEEGKICSEYSTTWYSGNGIAMGEKRVERGNDKFALTRLELDMCNLDDDTNAFY
jgi:hypothetical protein